MFLADIAESKRVQKSAAFIEKMAEKMNTLKDYVRAMFTGKVPFDPPVTFPRAT